MVTPNLIRGSSLKDTCSKEQIIRENTGLIYMVVNRFLNRGVESDDLFQIAALGLLKAIDNFNSDLGLQFSTYAVPMMMGEIRRHLRDTGPIKVSRTYKIIAAKATALREKLMKESGKEPTVSELAARLSLDPVELASAITATRAPDSLDAPAGDSNTSLKDLIPSGNDEENFVTRLALSELIEALPSRERAIIILRYSKEETQSQIAKRLGISQVQVSRLEKKILEKLKMQL